MPSGPVIPKAFSLVVEGHQKWKKIVEQAQKMVQMDADLQLKASKGLYLKERALAPQVVGRTYAEYCSLVNRMYDVYVNSVQLQRAEYMKEIVTLFVRRLFELRRELVNLILTDYIYVDTSLVQLHLQPQDVEILIPCHFAEDMRSESIEELLQTMWIEAEERKNAPPPPPPAEENPLGEDGSLMAVIPYIESAPKIEEKVSEHTIPTEDFLLMRVIQAAERHRQWYMRDFYARCATRRMYFAVATEEPPDNMKHRAASIIQKVIRGYMEVKRERSRDHTRNMIMGMVPDPWRPRLDREDETRKLYMIRHNLNKKLRELYEKESESEKSKLYFLKKDEQMEDISDEVRQWFRDWYQGYGFFPEFPYELEGGTLLVARGQFITIEEKIEQDELEAKAKKVKKTKEQIKSEKKQAQMDALLKAEQAKEDARKAYLQEVKLKSNPFADPGYKVQSSKHMESMTEAFKHYSLMWSIYDNLPPKEYGDVVYGYMKTLLTEKLMCQLHLECRVLVDELLRLEWKTLIAAQQKDYRLGDRPFPKVKPRKKPREVPVPVPYQMSETIKDDVAKVFDLEIVSKPTARLRDIIGDSNYVAYDLNIADPNATFPPPGYGDIRNRLKLSCVFGAGLEPGADRNKSVLLLGPPMNGKSFLVDCVAGEMNAVKFDISPEVFSSQVSRPGKILGQVFAAARAFQPSIIFIKNVERVFKTKLSPEEKLLKVKSIKKLLIKYVKGIAEKEKIIFIATCSSSTGYPAGPVMSLFSEVLLVPRPDYGTVRQFFYYKLQSIRSIDRDYCVQPLAQMLQGFGFGVLIEAFNKIMTPDRIVKLNVDPFEPLEYIEYMMQNEKEPTTLKEFEAFQDLYIKYSSLKTPRADYVNINRSRADAYVKMKKKLAEEAAKEEAKK